MLSVVITESGRPVQHKLHARPKATGWAARSSFGRCKLYRRLLAFDVADVNVNMGMQDLLLPIAGI